LLRASSRKLAKVSDTETPKWFENDEEADAFIDKNREKLIDKLGLGDLFTGDDPPKASKGTRTSSDPKSSSTSGPASSVSIPSNQMQDVMGALVAQSIGALKDAAVGHSAASAGAPSAPAVPKTRKHWLLGDIIDE
jgi:hypothetical protein